MRLVGIILGIPIEIGQTKNKLYKPRKFLRGVGQAIFCGLLAWQRSETTSYSVKIQLLESGLATVIKTEGNQF